MPDKTQVNILGVDVIRLREEEAVSESIRLLKEPGPGVIFFLTAGSSLLCRNDEEAARFVNRCNLVLPGDLHTEKAFLHLLDREREDEADGEYAGRYMNRLFSRMNEEEYSIYAIMDTDESLLSLQEYILTNYPGINLDGILSDSETEGEAGRIVNDINACLPDIVFLCISAPRQIRFVRQFASMMNTGLCICIESMQPWLHKETVAVPGLIRSLGLGRAYLWLTGKRKLKSMITGSIFRSRVLNDSDDSK